MTDTAAIFHDGVITRRVEGLATGSAHVVEGIEFRTLARPGGALLARIACVNDVHFGEAECGRIDDHAEGPIQRSAPGEPPYPELMNAAVVAEIAAAGSAGSSVGTATVGDPGGASTPGTSTPGVSTPGVSTPGVGGIDAVVVRGDLTADGRPEEFAAFERCYRTRFGDRLVVVRGNHDAYRGQSDYAGDTAVVVPGLVIALVDTVIPERTSGRLRPDQLDWLDTLAADADRPVVVMGHHPQWTDGTRSPDYFGINPDDSDALTAVIARRPAIVAYSSGHTHRHRVRRLASGVPSIELGCVKDFPGTWAELQVYEGGILHIVHRICAPEAMAWSERCRHLYRDFGVDYETYALGSLDDRCFAIGLRS